MPGGRLAHEDRRRIADGLTEGLGYAEIARQLGRPTSTISREVARNGGPTGYHPDQAHEATTRRAHRPRSPLPNTTENGHAFVDRFATLLTHTGLPRMAARVLAALITTDSGSRTAAELVANLRVSPASVSKAVGYLENLTLIRRERTPRRRDHYVIDDDVWLRAWSTDAQRHASVADTAADGAAILGPTTPAGARLTAMSQFFANLSEDMSAGPDPSQVEDAWTVLAALAHATTPKTTQELANALTWPPTRVTEALTTTDTHPHLAGPLSLTHTDDTHTVIPHPHRLTREQQAALRPHPTNSPPDRR